jgi:hypothetical protein
MTSKGMSSIRGNLILILNHVVQRPRASEITQTQSQKPSRREHKSKSALAQRIRHQ